MGFCFFPPTLSSCLSLPPLNYFPKNTFWKFSLSSTPLTQFSTVSVPQYPYPYQFTFSNANVAFAKTTLQSLSFFLSASILPSSLLYLLTYCFFLHSSFHRLYIIVVFLLCGPPPLFLSLAFFLLSLLCFSLFFFSFFFCLHFWLFYSFQLFILNEKLWRHILCDAVPALLSIQAQIDSHLLLEGVGWWAKPPVNSEVLADIPPQWTCWVRMVSLPTLLSKLEVCRPVHKAPLTWLPSVAPLVLDGGGSHSEGSTVRRPVASSSSC